MFCEKKNLSVRRKIFKVWRRGKNVSTEFRVFGKKKEIERKVPRKKIKLFLGLKWRILLSSYSLVGLYVHLQVKVTEKNDENLQSVFRLGVSEVKIVIFWEKKNEVKNVGVVDVPLVGLHVVKHG